VLFNEVRIFSLSSPFPPFFLFLLFIQACFF
jgi:hypothetical protein